MKSKKIKIIHFITTLGLGGAEKVLFNILKLSNNKYFEHYVVCLKSSGYLNNKIKKLNIKIYSLNLDKFFFAGIMSCISLLKSFKNKENIVIQTWLPHADFIGGLLSRICGYKKIIWNIRISNFSRQSFKLRTLVLVIINSIFSYFIPKKIISCSLAGIKAHLNLGYKKSIFYLIHNGFDKVKIRKRSSKFSKKFTIGIFSRFHKVKNHIYLLRALKILKKKKYDFRLLLLGPNINFKNKKLIQDIKNNNLINETIFINKKGIFDINKYFSYLDLYILCSRTEGFPNILGEAIMNGVNVLSTDVGDAKLMVPSKKNIIHNSDVIKFSKKIENLANLYSFKKSRNDILKKNSFIFHSKFSQNKMLYKYQKIWKSI
jgi:glycosyltransferase involved in cell wall biosynthesis